jgi:thioredoxin-related protein
MKFAAWRRFAFATLVFMLWSSGPIAAVSVTERIEPARNLQADTKRAATAGIPLIVLVSLADCTHCEMVRRSYLLPLQRQAPNAPALIRQVELNGNNSLIGFNGEKLTHAEFSRGHKATVAPVVLFFGADGERIAEPLLGAMIADFYGAYFDAALATAKARMSARKVPPTP